jgi:lactoylglutathione lyase
VKLNHLHLTVTDVQAAADFLERYFGCEYQGGNKGMAFMFDDDGLVLTLMRGKNVTYPGHFHIGFHQAAHEEVDAIYQRLVADGYTVDPPAHSHGYTFYVDAPGGFTVEVLA